MWLHCSPVPRLPYLRSDLSYLNMPPTTDTIAQLDGADDGELLSPVSPPQIPGPFQNPVPAGMAAAACGGPELDEVRPPDVQIKKKTIKCDYCEQEFASAPLFNAHTIQCAKEWVHAQRKKR